VSRLAVLALRHRSVVALLALAVVLVGVFAGLNLPRRLLPVLSSPTVTVIATGSATTAEASQQQVTALVEAAAHTVAGVVEVTSSTSAGRSLTTVRFADGQDATSAGLRLQSALSQLGGLPSDIDWRVVQSTDELPVAQVAVTAELGVELSAADLAQRSRQALLPVLSGLPGVAAVSLQGAAGEVVDIRVKADAMAQYGVSTQQILSVLQDNGVTLPAGVIGSGGDFVPVEIGQPLQSIDQLSALPLLTSSSGSVAATPSRGTTTAPADQTAVVTLGQVADITQAAESTTSAAHLCQVPFSADQGCATAVILALAPTPDGDPAAISRELAQALDQAADSLAQQQLQAQVVYDQAPATTRALGGLAWAGLIALIAAIVAIVVFLSPPRTWPVAAAAVPLALGGTLIGLWLTGQELNLLTLAGLAVAAGVATICSGLVAETVTRRLAQTATAASAVAWAGRETGRATSLATVCLVLSQAPLFFVPGAAGRLCRPFAWTVVSAAVISWLVAWAVLPGLASRLRRRPTEAGADPDGEPAAGAGAKPRRQPYSAVLRGVLAHPVVVTLATLLLVAATVWFGRALPVGATALDSSDSLVLRDSFAPGTSLAVLEREATTVENALGGLGDYVQTIQTVIEADPTGLSDGASVTFWLALEPAQATAAPAEVRRLLAGGDSGQPLTTGRLSLADGTAELEAADISLRLRSTDTALLASATAQVHTALQGLAGVAAVADDVDTDQYTASLQIDRAKAASFGLTEQEIAQLVAATASPSVIGQIDGANGPIDVEVVLGASPTTAADWLALPIGMADGSPVTLGQVAQLVTVQSSGQITTADGQFTANVTVAAATDDLSGLSREVDQAVAGLALPDGVTVDFGGGGGGGPRGGGGGIQNCNLPVVLYGCETWSLT